MAQTTNLSLNYGGTVQNSYIGTDTFTNLRNLSGAVDALGNTVFENSDSSNAIVSMIAIDTFSDNNREYYHNQWMFDFDLSSISTTITGLTLKLKGKTNGTVGDVGAGTTTMHDASIIILKSEHQDTPDLTDFNNFTGHTNGWGASDVTEFSSAFGPAAGGWSTSAYNEITLNSDAISDANTQKAAGNRFKMVCINKNRFYDNDTTNLGESTGTQNRDYFWVNMEVDTENDDPPILVVTHEDAPSPRDITGPLKIQAGGKFQISAGKLSIKT